MLRDLHFPRFVAGSAVLACSFHLAAARAQDAPSTPLPSFAVAPDGAYRLEYDGALWVAPIQGEIGRERLRFPPKPANERPPDTAHEFGRPLAFVSPDHRWIYAEDYRAAPGSLYQYSPLTDPIPDPFHCELVEGFADAARDFFLSQTKPVPVKIVGTRAAFAGWSADSARVLIAFNFQGGDYTVKPGAIYAQDWFCYYNTRTRAFELTDRLRTANKGRVDPPVPKGASQANPPVAPVLHAESIGEESPEESVGERFKKADARLNRIYAQLLRTLGSTAKTKLRAEERQWLDDRETTAWIHAVQSWSPFPETSHLEGEAIATETRIIELQKRLHAKDSG